MFELGKKNGSSEHTDDAASHGSQPEWAAPDAGSSPESSASSQRDVAVIGRSIRIDGDLKGEEDLRIEGDVSGTIMLKNNTLTIGSEGKIRADVYAKSVAVEGVMEGDLFSSERVSIRRSAQVHGNITAPRVSLEEGAKFKGSIEMDSQAVQAALGDDVMTASETMAKISSKPTPISTTQSHDEDLAAEADGADQRKAAES